MTVNDVAKILENLVILVSKKIDRVAKKFRSGPERYAAVAKQLDALSKATQKLASECPRAIQSLPKDKRDDLLSALEKSGVTNVTRLVTPVLQAQGIFDDCLGLHEFAKMLQTQADIADIFEAKLLAAILTMAALVADLAAQECDERASEELEQKINFIMDLPEGADVPTVPDKETPTSLTTVRKLLQQLEQKIDFIMDLPPGVAVPAVPKDETPTSLTALRKLLEVAKKFYKFEGSFRPTFKKDKQLIRIGPLATSTLPTPPIPILVTGLIDLSGMQNHDVVTITTKVLEPKPSPQYVIWRVKTFTGPQSSGIKHFQDFADLLEVPGDGVEVLIAQSASSHNFNPAFLLTIPYQFLVETTVLPDFNVS
jgi:hypothetical protein